MYPGRRKGAEGRFVMFGHTHRPFFEEMDEIIVLNPGSLSFPRQEGRKGSYMIMETDGEGRPYFKQCYLE